MTELKRLPIGVESFEEVRQDNFYYVDKTFLIEQLLTQWSKVTLFTRPRRFGKSLNMSMLQSFFSIETEPSLFENLYISQNKKLCSEYRGNFPVIFISLKSVNGNNFSEAYQLLVKVINEEARRFHFLMESENLNNFDKELLSSLFNKQMDTETLVTSLKELSEILRKHYNQKVIVLIDEYDVPLAKAKENSYYDKMSLLIRNLFENVLKTNNHLKLAVLTGCLRVAKESIFTGLNNFKVYSIADASFDEAFGFTDTEVKTMLHYYHLDEHYKDVKEWYDGYRFGNADVYCPWDVINYCSDHIFQPQAPPKNYWVNTSSNDVIEHFIHGIYESHSLTKTELERLVNGRIVQKEINQEITYKDLYSSIDNLWSMLFMTGYLTYRGEPDGNRYNLVIPNLEIRNIVTEHILKQFKINITQDGKSINEFCNALRNGQTDIVETLFTEYMQKTISIRDTFVRKSIKENFYHGLLLGILSFKENWSVFSNKESGNGFSDIIIQTDNDDIGIVIEIKYAENGNMISSCREALQQITDTDYTKALELNDVHTIWKYGIACYKKDCKVLVEK